MSFYKLKIVPVVFFGFIFFLFFTSQASAQQCIWRDTFGCAGFGEYTQYSPNIELCEGDPPNNSSTCCCRPSTPPPSGYQWTTSLSCGSLGYEWFQYFGDPNNCGVKPQGGTYCCVYQSNFVNIGGCCQRVCEQGSFNCSDGCFQGNCPNSIPGVVRYVYTQSGDCQSNVCVYVTASTGTVDTVQSEPIEFKPQVTIPGSIKIGDKTFSINRDQGIIVDGALLSRYIGVLFNWLIGVIGIIAVVYLGWGGMQWLAAAGSAESINKAKETIKDAIIGLVLVAGSYTMLFIINPQLVGFDKLNIEEVEGIILISDTQYEKITGKKPVKAFSEEMKNAMRQVSQANNIHYCVLATIFTKESAGNVKALGHDENVRKEGIKSRRDFINSGCLLFSGKKSTAVCSITGAAINDDKIDEGKSDLGLDWRFSHGIGVGQITIYPNGPACNGASHCRQIGNKSYTPKSLFDLNTNLDAVVTLWKTDVCSGNVNQDCFRKYNGSGPAAEEYGREAWAIYNNCLTQNP